MTVLACSDTPGPSGNNAGATGSTGNGGAATGTTTNGSTTTNTTGSSGAGGSDSSGSAGATSGPGGAGTTGGAAGTTGAGGSAGGAGGAGGGSAGAGMAGTAGKSDAGPPGDAAVGGGCPGIIGHPTKPCDTIPVYPGVKLKLVEDFDSPIDLDKDDIWTYSDGFSDQAQARFIKGAITFANGSALITMNKPAGGAPIGPTYAEGNMGANGYPAPFNFASPQTSGELRTKYNNFKYGYYEFRIKPPTNTTGNFIAAAFTFRTPKWQDWRELDIELQAAGKSRTVPTNVIVGENQGGWSPGISDAKDLTVNYDTQADFHTYGFDWEPNVVNFYIDRATNPTPVRVYATGSKLPIPNKSAKIMMNFWLFPSNALGGGDPANNTYPMSMQVDYVHFYKSDQEPFYPCTPTPACLSDATHKEDLDYSKNNPTDGLPTTPAGL
jgi:hypothetical protein